MQNKNTLLLILGGIILIKYMLMPIIEWQNDSVEQLVVLNKKLDKSLGFINELPRLEQEKVKLADFLKTIKLDVDTYQDISRYQLDKQREIEKVFAENKIIIKSFNWRDIVKIGNGSQLKLMIRYSGKLKDFISLHMAISQFNRSVEVTNFGLNIRTQTDKSLGDITGSIVLVFHPIEVKNANI